MAYGDHLVFSRAGFYDHHALDLGDGTVIHLTGQHGKAEASIVRSRLEDVERGSETRVVPYALRFSREESVRRAWSQLGRRGYSLTNDNCQHFIRWCVTGEYRSEQIERAQAAVGGGAGAGVATAAALGTVGAIGSAVGVSGGANVMAGFAGLGSVVGGGVPAGLALGAAGPGVIGAIAMDRALADDPHLTARERAARQQGPACQHERDTAPPKNY